MSVRDRSLQRYGSRLKRATPKAHLPWLSSSTPCAFAGAAETGSTDHSAHAGSWLPFVSRRSREWGSHRVIHSLVRRADGMASSSAWVTVRAAAAALAAAILA